MSAFLDPTEGTHCERCGAAFHDGDDVMLDAGLFVHANGCGRATAAAIDTLAGRMRADSEHWFPGLHSGETSDVPLFMHYALGLIGEAGEVANVVKKLNRDGHTDERMADLGAELADVLVYLLLLAGETGIDIVAAYETKRERNTERWGVPA